MYFNLPNVAQEKQISCLVNIIKKQREELIPLRIQGKHSQTRINNLEQEIKQWKDKYHQIKQERDQFKRENGKLKQEIERLTKSNSRYRVSLFDHGNFKSKDNGEKRQKGGQSGHQDTNRENQDSFSGYENFERKRIYAKTCGKCGNPLERVNAAKQKLLLNSVYLRDELVRIYHLKQQHPEYLKEKLEQVLTEELDRLLAVTSKEESFQNIQGRLRDQQEGLTKLLLETDSGTNNLAERELREVVLGRKISFGSDTYTGMQTTAILASVIQTLGRDKQKDMLTELTLDLQIGIHEKYPQYTHLAYFDSS